MTSARRSARGIGCHPSGRGARRLTGKVSSFRFFLARPWHPSASDVRTAPETERRGEYRGSRPTGRPVEARVSMVFVVSLQMRRTFLELRVLPIVERVTEQEVRREGNAWTFAHNRGARLPGPEKREARGSTPRWPIRKQHPAPRRLTAAAGFGVGGASVGLTRWPPVARGRILSE